MTVDELNSILESHEFKSSFKYGDKQYVFSFKDNYIGRDGIPIGRYKLTKTGDNFRLTVVEKKESVFTDNFKNIILIVKDDNRFPVILNFEGQGLDITFKAQKIDNG